MTPSRPTRRQFAATLAAAGCASLVTACARTAPAAVMPRPAAAAPDSTADAGERTAREAAAEHLVTVVAGLYAPGFPAAHRNDVRGGVARMLQLGEALRRAPVANDVDPYSVCGVAEKRA